MVSTLHSYARETLFLIRESNLTRKLILPKEWRTRIESTRDGFLGAFSSYLAGEARFLILVDEQDFMGTVEALKQKEREEFRNRCGIVVLCEDPEAFLREKGGFVELLDVLSEKEARKQLEFHLLRALRQLIRADERQNNRFSQKTLEQLNEIFIAMSAERNPQRLLATILLKAMDLTLADGGILYMLQEKDGEMYFRLKISYDRSNEITFQHSTVKVVENSICGYVALTGKTLNIPQVNELRPLTLPQYNRTFDYNPEDMPRSLLSVPFKNGRNEIIAVLQLANKRGETLTAADPAACSFETDDESLLRSFATQAAICLENVDLYADIQRLFEGFIKASITAIESRDPSTGGHSERVAKICVALARATTECETGIYRSVRFKEEEIRELEYAALLHDFGKIGVREDVLVKAKKLYPYQLEAIKERIKICKAAAKIAYLEKRIKQGGHDDRLEKEFHSRVHEIDNFYQIIMAANEPSVLQKQNKETLDRIRSEQLLLPDGSHIAVLTEEEYNALSVSQGSLTESERLEIESHVRHTYQFLKMIPWTKDFRHLTEIAYCHHEKLDGSGYPRGLMSHEIPLQSKIMTIADIFDALTAADRWYKEAVPTEKAIEILAQEVGKGQLDPVLFELFVQKKIFELTQPKALGNVP
jgi:HD-GYP domain-containing protein (c-di-GMP phosphodiesterase class II)